MLPIAAVLEPIFFFKIDALLFVCKSSEFDFENETKNQIVNLKTKSKCRFPAMMFCGPES
jgi:hypothetical protein